MDEKQEKLISLAKEVLTLSRNTLLVNLRFLDMALSMFEYVPIDTSTLMTDGKHILFNPRHVLECYSTAKEIPVRDYLHLVMHCTFRHMFVDPSLDRVYWDLACDIAVENVITELGLRTVSTKREAKQEKYISAIKESLKHVTAEKIYYFLRETQPDPLKIAEIRAMFLADNHEMWYMTPDEIAERFGLTQADGKKNDNTAEDQGDGEGMVYGVASVSEAEWQRISERMQVDMETFGKQRGLLPGAMTQNLAAVNREKYDYAAFLKKFAVMGEAMKINDDEFDYVFHTYGLQLYEKMPLIEPLEYPKSRFVKTLSNS